MHFPSLLSFKDFTWLVTILLTACMCSHQIGKNPPPKSKREDSFVPY